MRERESESLIALVHTCTYIYVCVHACVDSKVRFTRLVFCLKKQESSEGEFVRSSMYIQCMYTCSYKVSLAPEYCVLCARKQ